MLEIIWLLITNIKDDDNDGDSDHDSDDDDDEDDNDCDVFHLFSYYLLLYKYLFFVYNFHLSSSHQVDPHNNYVLPYTTDRTTIKPWMFLMTLLPISISFTQQSPHMMRLRKMRDDCHRAVLVHTDVMALCYVILHIHLWVVFPTFDAQPSGPKQNSQHFVHNIFKYNSTILW